MSSENVLEVEELENVPLVRMADVQPDRSGEYTVGNMKNEGRPSEVLETCIVDGEEYEACLVDDDDSNIGSMVSIQSEDVVCDEEPELIVPEVLGSMDRSFKVYSRPLLQVPQITKPQPPDSWPTLEILPGGVINLADKTDPITLEPLIADSDTEAADTENMMYACAKCSQSFKYLFCLVKHVRWHEDEKQREKMQDLAKLTPIEQKMADLERRGTELDKRYRNNKEVIGVNSELSNKIRVKEKNASQHTGKRKTICKPKLRRVPKKS
ncbi:uncharacterized protein LOC126378177 [Pectinophora gossypiella]|uniref:C2H2-type domain-containing protein n=1 Tax=Pectinophora gossypiella TaxID=13191 RepID=A0A1E1W1T9_PECGO|nr:uncharacterized protein LOC126378177 [Pectinophora gossypiella]